MLYMLIS